MGSIVFVHGTGVRLSNYQQTYENARNRANACGINEIFVPCAWGDPLGVAFEGKSLPDSPSPETRRTEEEDFARWSWLLDDPLALLDMLTIKDETAGTFGITPPGQQPEWERVWNEISQYTPSMDLRCLLDRGGHADLWESAWGHIMGSPIPRSAFEASGHELADAANALARAIVAQLHVTAVDIGRSGPNRHLREAIVQRLTTDWHQNVLGLQTFFWSRIKRTATRALRRHRESVGNTVIPLIGDILLYQSKGESIREFIRATIASAAPPVTLLGHSLGGIACIDLLALPDHPKVHRVVTIGSQAPFLYEIAALHSIDPPNLLRKDFPRWLNLYDRNDFLSFIAKPLFPKTTDIEVESGLPFPESHSAYFGNDMVWRNIREFIAHE